MAIYAIGDIHGASHTFDEMLDALAARGPVDELWLVGDLVNRGPDSAGVIRRVMALGPQAVTVLGNHDLALLSLAGSKKREAKISDPGLRALLSADDRDTLLDWLRHRPLMHHDSSLGWTMVHAGFAPEWDFDTAAACARELQTALRGPDHRAFLTDMLGNTPDRWDPTLAGHARLRFIANALTRIRFVNADGRLDMQYKKTIADAPEGLVPWFEKRQPAMAGCRTVFGHWSALDAIAWPQANAYGIDTGAAWGGRLTALRLDTDEVATLIQISARANNDG